jgi:hypothetical protein
MGNWKYLLGLIAIICVVWLTMITCFVIVYFLLSSIELSSVTYIDKLILNAVQVLMAGFVFLGWLYSWNMLVRLYFRRNLGHGKMKGKDVTVEGKKGNTRARHVPRRSVS